MQITHVNLLKQGMTYNSKGRVMQIPNIYSVLTMCQTLFKAHSHVLGPIPTAEADMLIGHQRCASGGYIHVPKVHT